MRKIVLFLFLLSGWGHGVVAQTVPQWPEVTREMKPGARWWWMGSAVDDTNLKWNIGEYAKTGIGTLEITPIYGVVGNEANERSYLSASWMQALTTSQETGDAVGVDIDMNGGTGWPFGGPWVPVSEAAGKLVTKNTTLTADGTAQQTFDVTSPESNAPLSKVMAFQQDGDLQVLDVSDMVEGKTLKWTAPVGQWLLIAVYDGHTGQQVKRAAPGGEGYVLDHYDADAVKHYLEHFDQRFEATGARWPHTFFNDSYEVYGADWTPKMFAEFEKYRGYKLEENMDKLLGLGKRKDTDNQVLADYRQTLSDMLLNNFTRQWTAWAHGHGVTTRNQGHGSPGNLIDYYAAVDIPEIEGFGITDFKIDGLRTDPGFTSKNLSDLATLKYASSAAHITGKRLTSSETFTWLAEHFRVSLSQMKPELDLMFIAGVNHIFFHGTTYSPREAAWPGWKFYASIDMSPTNSIWRDAPAFMQYATRCQSFLQMGEPDNDLLVYAPFLDAMHKNASTRLLLFDINSLSSKVSSVVTAVKNIEDAGLDCDFISDELLLQVSCVDGMLETAAGTRYRGIVVPVSSHLPAAVKSHLDDLAAQGAKIVYQNTAAGVAQFEVQPEEIRTVLGLRMIRRKSDSGYHYFLTNLSPKTAEGMVSLAVPFRSIALFDPMTGSVKQGYTKDDKVWISLKSGQSVILQTFNGDIALAEKDQPVNEMAGVSIDSPWQLSFTDSTYAKHALQTYPIDRLQTWEQLDAATATAMGTGIYETTFRVDEKLLTMSNGGMRLDLGDVRESARIYINDRYAGCVWSAPFVVDCTGLVHAGENTLRIEVTNLPANRIRQMDIDGVKWRNFKDVNILSIKDGNTSQSGITYEDWQLVPSGLNSSVKLIPLRQQSTELEASISGFIQIDGSYYPQYMLTAPSGLPVKTLVVTDTSGHAFADYQLSDDKKTFTVLGSSTGYIVVKATDEADHESEAYLVAHGAYDQQFVLDFTVDEAPKSGWQVMSNKSAPTGFSGTCEWRRAPGQNSAKVIELSDAATAIGDNAFYCFYYMGRGMAVNNDVSLHVTSQPGDVCLLSYVVGAKPAIAYVASDSLLAVAACTESEKDVVLELKNRTTSYTLYRTLQQYRPRQMPTGVAPTLQAGRGSTSGYYTLQGVRLNRPQASGIYLRNGRKVVFKAHE